MMSFSPPRQFRRHRSRRAQIGYSEVGKRCLRRISTFQVVLVVQIFAISWFCTESSYADGPEQPLTNRSRVGAQTSDSTGEEVEVEKIKEKYWEHGSTADIGVVQNRIYSKKKKFELGIFGNNINSDPWLSVYSVGASLGYHFSEYFSTHIFAFDAFASPSGALTTLQNTLHTTANTNNPEFFYGAEVRGSFIYGKLSIAGELILYFDAYVTGGTGIMGTQSGNDLALFVGIGQQIHVSKVFSLNLDYRLMEYNETIIGKIAGVDAGQSWTNTNLSAVVTLGVSFLINVFH